MAELSDQEIMRYNRQIILCGFDFKGQEALKDARVLVIGLGGLGCAAAQYLAGAGIGHLALLDFDMVPVSSLQRQTLHSDATVGQPRMLPARDALTRTSPYIAITPVSALLEENQTHALIAEYDLMLDCTDNISIHDQLNAGCFAARVLLVSGAAIRMEGQIIVFAYQEGEPCYRCLGRLFGENALTYVEAGVITPLIGVIGSLQTMRVIKLLANYGKPVSRKVVMYGTMTCQFREIKLMRNLGCEVCGQQKSRVAASPYPAYNGSNVGRMSVSAIRQQHQIDVHPNVLCQSYSNFATAASAAGELVIC